MPAALTGPGSWEYKPPNCISLGLYVMMGRGRQFTHKQICGVGQMVMEKDKEMRQRGQREVDGEQVPSAGNG